MKQNHYASLAENVRRQGEGQDTILAHINPQEAALLAQLSGGGSINPVTGLPQFGLFSNPRKWFKSVLGPAAGSLIGHALLPGIGGVLGGAFGGAAGSVLRDRKDAGAAALRGAGIGAALPTAASLAGSGAKALGAKGLGSSLSKWGAEKAVLPSLGITSGAKDVSATGVAAGEDYVPVKIGGESRLVPASAVRLAKQEADKTFLESLTDNTKSFLTKPKNLLTLGTVGMALANRPKAPKEKSPEQIADEQKRLERALRYTPGQLREREAALIAEAQMRRRVRRQRFLPDEYIGELEPLHVRVSSPEEARRTGRWLNYYSDPEFKHKVQKKHGGSISQFYEAMQTNSPPGRGGLYISGYTSGQADKVPALLSDGEYVIPADVVAHLGDGNNNAGAKKLDVFLARVRNNKKLANKLPPKSKAITTYLKE